MSETPQQEQLDEKARQKKIQEERKEAKKKKQEERATKKQPQQTVETAVAQEERIFVPVTDEQVLKGEKNFGSFSMVQSIHDLPASKSMTGIDFVEIKDLTKELVGKEVCVRARTHNARHSTL